MTAYIMRTIRTAAELREVLEMIKYALGAGQLIENETPGGDYSVKVSDLPLAGPWPDYFEANFTDSRTGDKFSLKVNTYPGSGGTWAKVDT